MVVNFTLRMKTTNEIIGDGKGIMLPRLNEGVRVGDRVLRVTDIIWDNKGPRGDMHATLYLNALDRNQNGTG